MRLLLLGPNGQLGWELQRALAPLGEVLAVPREQADLDQPDRLRSSLRAAAPAVIVNAAACTDVDRAEAEPERAHRVNAEAPALLAEEAARLGAWLVHYGTDYVFDGRGETPYAEEAPARPLSAYGRSKWAGEAAVRASGCRHLVLRAGWLHAPRRRNFPLAVLRRAAEQERLDVVSDQVGAPTGADLVADVTAHALRAVFTQPHLAGTYHVAAAGAVSRHGCARFIVEAARALGWPLRLEPAGIVPVPSAARAGAALRPLNCRLDTAKLERSFGLVLPPWQAGLRRLLAERRRP